MPTIYVLLGVAPDADTGTIQHAYRRLVREVHPDAVLGRLPMEQAAAAERFRLLTDAWSIARDPHLRAEYDAFLSSAAQGFGDGSAQPLRPPGEGECRFCGYSPACEVTLRQEIGMMLVRRRRWLTGFFCRDCGIAMFRETTNRTLLTGWWGVLSFFTNLLTLAANLDARRRLGQLSAPKPNPAVAAWLPAPIPAGRPVFLRAGIWVSSVVLTLVALVAASSASSEYSETVAVPTTGIEAASPAPSVSTADTSSTTETTVDTTDLSRLAGRCITISNGHLDGVISCSSPHDARVVAITTGIDDCPSFTDGYFEQGATVVCVDQTATESTEPSSGLFCRDVKAQGGTYEDAVNYYVSEGRPARMDKDGNGIPCETVYSKTEVQEYLTAYGPP
jgi:hypothetical protein